MKIENRRITVQITTQEGNVITVNPEDTDQQIEIGMATNSTTVPGSNGARITILNLSKSSRDVMSSSVVTDITVQNLGIDVDVGKLRSFEQDKLRQFQKSISPNDTPKQIAHNRGDAYVEVFIGYGERTDLVFEGPTRWVDHVYQSPNWVTSITIDDGITAINGGVSIRSFPKRTKLIDIAKYVVSTMNIGPGNLTATTITEVFGSNFSVLPNAVHLLGRSSSYLSDLFTLSKGEWFVDRMQFYLTKKGEPLTTGKVLVSDDTGIKFLQVTSRTQLRVDLFPRADIRPGREVTISGRGNFDGKYRAEAVSHSGNNRHGDFGTSVLLSRQVEVTL